MRYDALPLAPFDGGSRLKREVQRRADVIDGLTREDAPESKVDDRLASKRSLHLEPIVVGIDETQTYFEEAPEKLCNEFVELVTYSTW